MVSRLARSFASAVGQELEPKFVAVDEAQKSLKASVNDMDVKNLEAHTAMARRVEEQGVVIRETGEEVTEIKNKVEKQGDNIAKTREELANMSGKMEVHMSIPSKKEGEAR